MKQNLQRKFSDIKESRKRVTKKEKYSKRKYLIANDVRVENALSNRKL